jgi:UDP-4-amino-4,6-dideoxy-N-acetyl-beta-L-altrosamine transaminase
MLPYGRQTIDDDDIAAVVEALRAPLLTCGPLVGRFEEALAARLGAPHASVCANGTAALHLAYAALDLGPGDELITTPITFSATAAAAYYVGAKVVLGDVDPRTGNLTPASVEALITPRTRGITAVHLGGLPVDLTELSAIARRHSLFVVEDACHALGATYQGQPIGASPLSDAAVFSFHPVKHITTGEGGAIVTRDPAIKRRIDRLRHHGIERDPAHLAAPSPGPWGYEVAELGWNYRLPDLNCALGLSQLAKLDRFVGRRRELAARYGAALATTLGDRALAPLEPTDRTSAYHLFAVAIDFAAAGVPRAELMTRLAAAGVGTQVHYIPLRDHPLHAARIADDGPRPGAAHYYARTLSLPMFPAMTDADVDQVVHALAHALEARHEDPALAARRRQPDGAGQQVRAHHRRHRLVRQGLR